MSDMVEELIVSLAKLGDSTKTVCSKLRTVLETTPSAEEALAKMQQIVATDDVLSLKGKL